MAESPEEPPRSGLARSIDALFSATPRAGAPPSAKPAQKPASADEPVSLAREIVVERQVPPEDPRPLAPHMFPQTQMLEAIPQALAPASEASAAETLMSLPSAAGTSIELPEASSQVAEPDVEVAAHTWKSSTAVEPPAPRAEVHGPPAATDGDGFRDAVNAYVGGDRAARSRVESLAEGLKDRLALDPLADAVEKLVLAAGDPPDPAYLDVALAVMNPAVASRLVQRMGRERDEEVRTGYKALFVRLGRIMANALKGALTGATELSVRRVYHETLISMGDVSRPVIEAMVEDENRFLVRDAVVMLGEIGGARAVELVTSALANTDARVRVEALRALGKLGDVEAGRLALGFLDDADSNVRLAAAVTAGRLGLERALRPLLHLLEEEGNPEQRILLLQALGELGDPGAVPAIEKHATGSRFAKADSEVRVAAYRALQRIGTPHARELVQRAANDKDPAVRAALRGPSREG